MKPSNNLPPDRTTSFVLLHGSWRVVLTLVAVTVPIYGWILLYYLSTGASHQPVSLVAGNAPLLATFLIPLLIGAWVIGFRGKYVFIGALSAAIIAGWTSPMSLARQLFLYSYVNLAIVLVLVMIGWHIFYYWREYKLHQLPIARYTIGACVTVAVVVASLLILLLPIKV